MISKVFLMAAVSVICSMAVLANGATMVPETLWEFRRISDTQVSPDGKWVLFSHTSFDVKQNRSFRDLYKVEVRGGGQPVNLTNSTVNESNGIWRPDGKKIGFIREGQIWEMNPDGSNPVKISDLSGGVTGFGYSPDMKHLFFTARVKVNPSVNDIHSDLPLARAFAYDDLMYRHWDQWHDGTFNHVFVAPYHDGMIGNPNNILAGLPYHSPLPPFGGNEQISWSPDGRYLFYTSKKMAGKDFALSTNSSIYRYDLNTRESTDMTPFNPGYDRNPVISPDGKHMAWESMQKDGFESDKNRIMIMNLETGTYRDFSVGFDQSSRNFSWSADSRRLFFISGINATYQVYSLDLASGHISQLTTGAHDYQSVDVAGRHLIAQRMSMSMPTEIFRIDENRRGFDQVQLTFVNAEVLNRLNLARVEERWIKTTDNKDMLVWVIYPPDFDPNKKYPALLFCGGGPQNAISQAFSYRWNFQLMAAKGYIVVAPNRRGLPTFGQEWNDQISLDYGGQNKLDLLSAIDALAAEPYVDENRLGAVGASFGGFSVFWLAGHHQGRFKAFIAHCGMFNFESWYGTTEEMFFANHDLGGPYWDTPRPHSYNFSPHLFVGNWDTPILVIHGLKDFRVPYSQGLEAFNAAQLRGIPSRFLVFPEENHWILSPQNSIVWQREFFGWLDKWLK
ncbi:MAG TPA: S9 family peptidase [Bacteroidales bacterium]|nr:S9 family peptidase [Bacteroidales bacterium]